MRAATPEIGEHTGEVLAELGLSDEEIDDLRRHGVV
jgi:crotonobetainyl-CoA:carnitine CoA-transferase CaiB-like acyl-CoA transferase